MPFVTEEIWQKLLSILPNEANLPASIMIASYPNPKARLSNEELEKRRLDEQDSVNLIEVLIELIRAIRNIRAEFKIDPRTLINANIISGDSIQNLPDQSDAIKALARLDSLSFSPNEASNTIKLVIRDILVTLDLGSSVDIQEELNRIQNEISELQNYATSIKKRLSNDQFISKAPAEVVDKEKSRLEEANVKLKRLQELQDNLLNA